MSTAESVAITDASSVVTRLALVTIGTGTPGALGFTMVDAGGVVKDRTEPSVVPYALRAIAQK